MSSGPQAQESPRAPRADGEASRERLLQAGLRLFANQGFAKTSTRELAEAANVNVASISYYFGDKAGFYRAVFFEPMGFPQKDVDRYNDPALTLAQALHGYYVGYLEPLKLGEATRLCMKLHLREILEPTGLWQEEITRGIKPAHEALVAVLCRHLGVPAGDDEVQRLAILISALGVHLHIGHDVIDALVPDLNPGPKSIDTWTDRLVMYAMAMVEAEGRRRRAEGGAT
jgi:AcrR family transcriptional regulator